MDPRQTVIGHISQGQARVDAARDALRQLGDDQALDQLAAAQASIDQAWSVLKGEGPMIDACRYADLAIAELQDLLKQIQERYPL